MTILCKQCGVPTVPRQIQKGPRGPWTAHECHAGCMNGQYKLTTSPPRKPAAPMTPQAPYQHQQLHTPSQQPQQPNEATIHLKAISLTLDSILALLRQETEPLNKEIKRLGSAERDLPPC